MVSASRYFVFFFLEFLDPVLIVVSGVIGWTLGWLFDIARSSARLESSSCWDSPEREEARSCSETSKFKSAVACR